MGGRIASKQAKKSSRLFCKGERKSGSDHSSEDVFSVFSFCKAEGKLLDSANGLNCFLMECDASSLKITVSEL